MGLNEDKIIQDKITTDIRKEYFNDSWICSKCHYAHIIMCDVENKKTILYDCDFETIKRTYNWKDYDERNHENISFEIPQDIKMHLGFLGIRPIDKSNLMLDDTPVKLGRRAKLEEVPLSYAQYKELDEKFFELTNAFHNMEIMMHALKDKFERD